MSDETPGEDEQYCRECGEIILTKAEICPECGVRQAQTQTQGQQRQQQVPHNQTAQPTANSGNAAATQSYGILFAIIDSWKYQRPLRHLLNIVMALSTVGVYLIILLVEGLIHYRNLNSGSSQPYDESKSKVWTTFTHVQ
ncbi:hypothetical protein [Halobellus inordinatus]|uniref:hypothetical protein n=1 Tax=Halobellus inordinatus TaxID=1126236 RepID=UPI00210EC81D|nr:hypothetical protein [Halobellus inordinatus]